ncbi:glycerol-3-phosphate 1-O-acyltransferase PlsB [Reinekea blandensis]|uniref:Glycerol-3-phosphate acyltransferase n=1 Tax=Reinekea blandensis MED297 TaxID=314283 RepID=A4BC09_9GAMM|nr:glycerol-3-phosphate 1-O-acyltransferase PlsB [Reinekea blandensis]EAR10494.1 Glycerol-3-phosphate O-acyltransferase [Reinekea sp. MED297] [Reinekea blandensis MED297]
MSSFRSGLRKLVQTVLFWWVKVPQNPHHTDLETLKRQKHCVFVLEHQSTADALVADHELKRLGFPGIYQSIDLPELKDEAALLTVHARPSVIRRHKAGITPRIETLLNYLAEHEGEDIYLVPVALFWGRAANSKNGLINALLSSNWTVIGRFRKLLTVIFNGRNTYLEINEPVSLRELVNDNPDISKATRKVARVLRVHFRHVRTAVIGPDLSHRRVMIDRLLKTDPVRNAIEQHAQAKDVSIEKARALAHKHAMTIAADVSYGTIRALDVLLTRLWNKIYNGVRIHGIEPVRELAKDNEIVYVPCHRSHIDYLLLSYCLYKHGLNVPHIAAGENLNMPVVGTILRRGGAFFIRRRFGGDKLYTAVFNEYIHTVFSRGYPVEYFVEGGRSRTGRMRTPATGTLAMTVRSHLRDNSRPVVFIPVYIGYEKVFESRSYLGELKGKEKKKENLFDLVKSVKQLKNYGHVFLNFGQPLSLNDQLNTKQPQWQSSTYGPDDRPAWMFNFVDELATDVVTRINSAAALNPVNLIATALLSTPRQAIEGKQLRAQLRLLVQLQKDSPYSDFITLPEGDAESWIDYAVQMGTLRLIPQKLGNLYGLDSQNTVLMSYYRNNIQHLFALPSLIAALIVRSDGINKDTLRSRIRTIYPYIQSELFIEGDTDQALSRSDRIIDVLKDQGLIIENEQGALIGTDKKQDQNLQLQYLSNIMLPTLERYLLTLSVLVRLGSGVSSQSVLENQAQQMAQRLALLNGLDAPEFFDKALFKNFIQALKNNRILTLNSDGNLEFDDRIPAIINQAASVIPDEIWYNIYQVTKRTQPGSEG